METKKIKYIGKRLYVIYYAGKRYVFREGDEQEVPELLAKYLMGTGLFILGGDN